MRLYDIDHKTITEENVWFFVLPVIMKWYMIRYPCVSNPQKYKNVLANRKQYNESSTRVISEIFDPYLNNSDINIYIIINNLKMQSDAILIYKWTMLHNRKLKYNTKLFPVAFRRTQYEGKKEYGII